MAGRRSLFADYAEAIADLSLRECRYLDELFVRNNTIRSDPFRKRRHRLFLVELLGFYFCETELLLRREIPGLTDRVLEPAVEAVARRATFDSVLDTPPYVLSDLMSKRYERYKRHIAWARARLTGDVSHAELVRRSAGEIARIALPFDASAQACGELGSQIEIRLRWTLGELGLPN